MLHHSAWVCFAHSLLERQKRIRQKNAHFHDYRGDELRLKKHFNFFLHIKLMPDYWRKVSFNDCEAKLKRLKKTDFII